MVDALRAADWGQSVLGPIERWSASLRGAVESVLDSPSARLLTWGPDFITIYNDAYVPVLGLDPQNGTGRPFAQFLPNMWLKIEPQLRAAMEGHGQIVTQLRSVRRTDESEETVFFRLSFTPIRDADGVVRGVMQDLVETTSYLKIQHELSSENRRFRELFNQAPVFLLLASFPVRYVVGRRAKSTT